jgi:decaprenyl-phosphate phosphoribosyltransferase
VTARPQQWVKNVLVLAAPCAAGVLTQAHAVGLTVAAFALFCLLSSGTYLVNDARDAAADRLHPTKCRRPVASGVLPVRTALAAGVTTLVVAVVGSAFVTWKLSIVFAFYVAVQVAYSLALKHLPVYDIAAVASGFVLRAVAGGVAVHVPVSQWFLVVATFGSLLMVSGKRLAEKVELGERGGEHRRSLDAYTPTFLRLVVGISATAALLGYSLWALSLQTASQHDSDPIWFQLSIVPVLLGLLRYTFLVDRGEGARPERLAVRDPSLVVTAACWLVLFSVGVYGR